MRLSSLTLIFTAALSCFSLAAAQVDSAAVGFGLGANPRAVGVFDAYATLASGERVAFDGLDVSLVSEDGSSESPIATFSNFVFPSFIVVDPTETFAVLAESSTGGLYRVDLGSGSLDFIVDIDNAYDLVFGGPDDVLVSAAPCFSNCGNDIISVDLASGISTPVAHVSENSGPLAVAANGDVYYGLQPAFGSPPGSWSVIRWTDAQIQSNALLGELDASLFATGLDGSASMAFDPVYGHLLVAESPFGGTSYLRAYDRDGLLYSEVAQSTGAIANVEVFQVAGSGSFQAWQPEGVLVRYQTADFFGGTAFTQRVTPQRPVATLSGPGVTGPGPITFTVTGAAPNSSFLFLIGPQAHFNPFESTIDTGRYLFHSGLGVFRRSGVNPPTDANGTGTHTFVNPGTLQGLKVMQCVIRDQHGLLSGTSTPVLL